ncbi:MAG: HEAT repeat domain-containing protein [Verrucomicrobiae bacterium]|nr:HEAT repeat domain-containing protein [Verrucomicrobiae bacterium]
MLATTLQAIPAFVSLLVKLMDKQLQRIVALLQSPDGMRRCAAAIVLAELAPKDPAIVRALAGALPQANQLLTRYILEAFEAIGTRDVVPHVLPLLESTELEFQLRAAGILARAGGQTIGELRRLFQKASPVQKRVLVDVLARIHSPDAFSLILEALFDPDVELAREAIQAIRRHLTDTPPAERQRLHRLAQQFIRNPRVRRDERVLASALQLIGALEAPAAADLLVQYIRPRLSTTVRRHALLGLKNLNLTGPAAAKLGRQLLPLLDDPDFVNIVQNALDLLEKLPAPGGADKLWTRYLRSKHPSVRTFAARQLAALDTPAANDQLLKLLTSDEPYLTEIAASALARHPGATRRLLQQFLRAANPDHAMRLARILASHRDWIAKPTRRKLAQLTTRELLHNRPRSDALLYLLRQIDSQLADTVLRDVGLRFKKAGQWARAIQCLKQLQRTDAFDDDLRFQLAVCDLKQSPKDLAPHLRTNDFALRGFQPLAQTAPARWIKLLQKERALDPADWFYLGFHFSESTGSEREFGRLALQHLIKRWPRSREAKTARDKLQSLAAATPPPATTPAPKQ